MKVLIFQEFTTQQRRESMTMTHYSVIYRKSLEKRIRRVKMRPMEMQKPGGEKGDPGIFVSNIELKDWNHFCPFILPFNKHL